MGYVEKYISFDDYIDQYVSRGIIYEGFVRGYGYVYRKFGIVMPPHLNGYNPESGNIPISNTHYTPFEQQAEICSLEVVKLSYRDLFKNGKAEYVVELGDTLEQIAFMFNVLVEDIVKWNSLKNINNITAGQVIVIKDVGEKILNSVEKSSNIADVGVGTMDVYWNGISKSLQQKRAYQLQKMLKNNFDYVIKTKQIKSFVNADILKKGGRILGLLGLGFDIVKYAKVGGTTDKVDAGTNVVIDVIGFSSYGTPFALYWNLGGEWLHKNWREKVLRKQIDMGIEGCASVMPFK